MPDSSNPLRRYQHGSSASTSESTPSPQWALVTGATNGMGYEWSRQIAALGFSLLIHGRSPEKLETTKRTILEGLPEAKRAEVQIKTLVADAGANPPNLDELDTFLATEEIDLRVVVNNIGITNEEYPKFEDVSDEDTVKMVALNMVFPTLVAKKTLPLLKRNEPSLMINVSSLGAYAPSPFLSVYSGSKAYNLQFSRALYNEMILEHSQVDVVAMVPGTVISGMNEGPPTNFMPLSSDWVSSALSSLAPSIFSSRPGPVIVPWGPHSRGAKFLNMIPLSFGDRMTRNFVKGAKEKKGQQGK